MHKKKKRRIFHPFLVAVFPILIIYSQNIGRMNFENSNLEDALGGPFIGCKNHRLCD